MISRIRCAVAARLSPGRGEEGAALVIAMLFMILLAGISVVLLSVVISQIVPSALAQKSTKTIYAAQAGLQTALGIVRSVAAPPDYAGKVYGDLSKLPCSLSGRVNAEADGITYSVAISYFTDDPTGKSSAWQSSNSLSCSAAGLTVQPKYAMILAQGIAGGVPGLASAATGNRYLGAIYKFKVSNVNIVGGRIFDYSNGYCLDAVTATAGSKVRFLPKAQCTNDSLELWIYDTDYQIKLASTTIGGAAGLCITGPGNPGEPTQDATLDDCLDRSDPDRWNQLWSWTGANAWQGQNKTIANGTSGYCLATGYATGTVLTGRYLRVSAGCNGGFAPTSQVGAGAAGYATKQIVNYKEFGRCADVTGENINAAFMISYPCKQDPTGTGVYLLWNHKWYYTEPAPGVESLAGQQIYLYYRDNTANKYCLTTPATGAGSYVVFLACSGSTRQNWTRVYSTGVYATSYLFVDTYGRCLTTDATDLYSGLYSKVKVASCNGSDAQKWNAPPTSTDSSVGGYREVRP